MTSFYFKKLILNDKIKKTISQKIKENIESHKLLKLVTQIIRLKISYMKKR